MPPVAIRALRLCSAAATLLALGGPGCGDDASASDAGVGTDADTDGGLPPASPAPPAPPNLRPCPTGWREVVSADGTATCDPWPASGYATCASTDEAHWPGTEGCARIGSACAAGPYASDLPTGVSIRYVLAGAAPGGDGSLASPFGTISEATRTAAPGSVVAIGKGDYDELVTVPAGVTLWGACVAETTLHASSTTAVRAVVTLTGAGGVIRNLHVTASPRFGALVDGAARDATVEDVVFDAVALGATASRGAHLTLRSVVIRNTTNNSVEVVESATADFSRVLVVRPPLLGLYLTRMGSLHAEDLVVREVAEGIEGRAIQIDGGSVLDATRLVAEETGGIAVFATGARTRVTLSDVVVRGGTSAPSWRGRAFTMQDGASGELTRGWLQGLRDIGIAGSGPGAVLRVRDVVVRDVESTPDGAFGRGAGAQGGATLELERALFEQVHDVGLFAMDADTVFRATDVTVRDVAPSNADPTTGRGIVLQTQVDAALTRVSVERVTQLGLVLSGPESSIRLTDVSVRSITGVADGHWGDGVLINRSGSVQAERLLVEDTRRFGVLAADGASLGASSLTIRRSLSEACFPDACPTSSGYGIGLGAVTLGRVLASDFVVEASALCGLLVDDTGELDLSDGTVRTAAVGACVQTPGYDLSRISTGVTFSDVGRTLDATSLPVPNLPDVLGGT